MWASEKADYAYGPLGAACTKPVDKPVGHYTQMVQPQPSSDVYLRSNKPRILIEISRALGVGRDEEDGVRRGELRRREEHRLGLPVLPR